MIYLWFTILLGHSCIALRCYISRFKMNVEEHEELSESASVQHHIHAKKTHATMDTCCWLRAVLHPNPQPQ